MTGAVPILECAGCGAIQPDATAQPYPFRCARAAELPDVDHVVVRTLPPGSVRIDVSDNPFLRYRTFFYAYHFALQRGLSDAAYVDLVEELDAAVARVDGRRFTVTPCVRIPALESAVGCEPAGTLSVKNETMNVAGSHKARHLMGVMLYLRIVETLGIDDPRRRGLAIASCGNAALAAAVVARAAGYPLRVFVPPTADAGIIDRIAALGARVEVCARIDSTRGDPAFLRFRKAVAEGALPFCCQGSENGLTIDGGSTLALELIEAEPRVDRLFVQVGGGALASACVRAYDDMHALGRISRRARIQGVQTCGAFPLRRAFDAVRERLPSDGGDAESVAAAMAYARTHRGEFMRPWPTTPRSIAHGILDDETYDWAAAVEGMIRSGGDTAVVSDDELKRANELARATTAIDVDHTGSAGLAGLIQTLQRDPPARREQLAVIFTGASRSSPPGLRPPPRSSRES